ncbi:uncharacterized protein LOC127136920 [Lathyrus oleraceus]|uniref:uncharacterized protein LOC127136920 n=1 Tax=Pisum sativum TaxID=3888 RepID=UPI0021D26956|nr:uncharacterized protein LOC127136920 [Pisum sativum]
MYYLDDLCKQGVDISDFTLDWLPEFPPDFMKRTREPSEKAKQAKRAKLGESSGSRPPVPLVGSPGKSVPLPPSVKIKPVASSLPQPLPIYTNSKTPPSTSRPSNQHSQKLNLATTSLPVSEAEMLNETTSPSSSPSPESPPYYTLSSNIEPSDPQSPTLAQLQHCALASQQPTHSSPEPEERLAKEAKERARKEAEDKVRQEEHQKIKEAEAKALADDDDAAEAEAKAKAAAEEAARLAEESAARVRNDALTQGESFTFVPLVLKTLEELQKEQKIQSIKGSDTVEKEVHPRSSDSDQRKTEKDPEAPTNYWSQTLILKKTSTLRSSDKVRRDHPLKNNSGLLLGDSEDGPSCPMPSSSASGTTDHGKELERLLHVRRRKARLELSEATPIVSESEKEEAVSVHSEDSETVSEPIAEAPPPVERLLGDYGGANAPIGSYTLQ